jgi:hypothetical protein
MNADARDDVYRVKLRASYKKDLVAAVRDPEVKAHARPQPVREADGSYSVVLFVSANAVSRLSALAGVQTEESSNMTASLRRGPLSAIEAGLEPGGHSAAPVTKTGKTASHSH